MLLVHFWNHLSKHRQKQFYVLLFLMIVSSFLEIVSIGAILPFIGVLISQEEVYQYQLIQPLIQGLELTNPKQLLMPVTIIFIVAIIFAGIVRLALLYIMTRLSHATGADLSIDIYHRTLHQDYSTHIMRNSSRIIDGIITKTSTIISGVLTPVLTLVSATIVLIGVLTALLLINTQAAILIFIAIGLIYWIVYFYSRQKVRENSKCIAKQSVILIKTLQEGLGGIRDVLIDGTQKFYCKLYKDSDFPLRHALGSNTFISSSPRYIVEAAGMTFMSIAAYIMIQQDGGTNIAVPVLAAFALGAQRLLPTVQQIYGSYSIFMGVQSSLEDVLELLNQPILYDAINTTLNPIVFEKGIHVRNLSFRYAKDTPWVLKNVNIDISKGSTIGFIGPTGSGKSTLLDIIMGLLNPSKGGLKVDGQTINNKNKRSWQAHIAHVPQHIYLSDSTIEENIAFGISKNKVDFQQVKNASKQAKITEFVDNLEHGYQTTVGEQGVKISGGQRQRIGIARAMYKKKDVLILDEATSALDNKTEKDIMEAIENKVKDMTILIIAHRLTTLRSCDYIIKLDNEHNVSIVNYEDIVNE